MGQNETLTAACARIRHVALDMDGTIYVGSRLFPWTQPFLGTLRRLGISYSFLTNNPTKSGRDYLKKLSSLGIDAVLSQMFTSAAATIDYIRLHHPEVRKVFILGTPSMQEEFAEAGFAIAEDSAGDRPDMLIVAFDTTLTYSRLCRAAWWAAQGLPYIATNPDRICPTEERTVLVDCGSVCNAIETATGRRPDIVIGKPNPGMLRVIMEKYGLAPDELAMCGDRLYTDIEAARNAGALGVLVLSGETTPEMAEAAETKPDITVETIECFGRMLERAHGEAGH